MRQMSRLALVSLGVVVVTTCAAGPSLFAATSASYADMLPNPLAYDLPPRLTSLTELGTLAQREDLTPAQHTDVLLRWLLDERRMPTPTTTGLGGGDITSGYIQQQFVRGLIGGGDPARLMQAVSDENLDPALRDAASLALAGKGDLSQANRVIDILQHSSEPYMRAMAAYVAGDLILTEAIPSLEDALHDDYWVHAGSSCLGDPSVPAPVRSYPVRSAAEAALRVLRDPAAMARKAQRLSKAQARLSLALEQSRVAPAPAPAPEVSIFRVLELAQSMYKEERLTGVLALPMMLGPQVEPALIEALDDPEWQIRWRAAQGLGVTAGPSVIPVLLIRMRTEWEDELAPTGMVRDRGYASQSPPVFIQDQMRVSIQRILERNPGPAADNAYASFVTMLQNQSEAMRIRTEMALLLAHFGDQRAIPVLISGLSKDRDGSIRAECATALGELGATEEIPALTAALADPYKTPLRGDLAVKEAAEEALAKLR